MASKCPKCHKFVEDDAVCCADLKYTWRCESCNKLSFGLVVPYGRCYLCGGVLEVVKGYESDDPELAEVVEEAARLEMEMYTFYRLAKERTSSPELGEVLQDLYLQEKEHLEELEEKYHLQFGPEVHKPPEQVDKELSSWLFRDIQFEDSKGHITAIYDQAIKMERRVCDYFNRRAETLPPGTARDLFQELAAEEEDHVAILETGRAHYD